MQLFAEVAEVLAMMLCGLLGYMSVQWLKRRDNEKLEGLCGTKTTCSAAETSPSDTAACKENIKQSSHQQADPRTERLRNKKISRKTRKSIHPFCDFSLDSSEGNTTVNLDVQCLPSVMLAETCTGFAHEQNSANAEDLSAAGWECATMNMDDVEADDEAEAEAAVATTGADNHEGACLCWQSGWSFEQERQFQMTSVNGSQRLMAHDMPEVGQYVEDEGETREDSKKEEQEAETEQSKDGDDKDQARGAVNLGGVVGEKEELRHWQQQVELPRAASANDEHCHFRKFRKFRKQELGELGQRHKTTGEASMKGNFYQSLSGVGRLSTEEERRRVPTSDWADAEDEEGWSESGYEAVNHSCLHGLFSSTSQHGTLVEDAWMMPLTSNQTKTLKSIDGRLGKQEQDRHVDTDNWMAPFAPVDAEVGQRSRQNDGSLLGWLHEANWFNEQRSKPHLAEGDCWMTPFDDLIQWTTPHAIVTI